VVGSSARQFTEHCQW